MVTEQVLSTPAEPTLMLRIVFAILLLAPLPAAAQVIRGTVTDASTNAPIAAVTVSVLGSGGRLFYSVVSAQDGTFELIVPTSRVVFVEAERIGYEGVTSTGITGRSGELLEIEVRLSPRAITLTPVEVVARKHVDIRLQGFLDRAVKYKDAGVGRIWTRADLEHQPPALVSHLVRMIPGRAGLTCSGTAFYVDNVRLATGDDDAAAGDFDMLVAPADLEGIEMYRDTDVPPDLLSYARRIDGSAFCMVVFAWRKPHSQLYGPMRPLWRIVFSLFLIAGVIVAQRSIF